MDLTNLQELKNILQQNNFYIKKKLGQNFLICKKTLNQIIQIADIKSNDEIIEIGPGLGVLTTELLNSSAKKITALEIDADVINILKKITNNHPNLIIKNISALEFSPLNANYLLVANIPYYLTSPLLKHFLSHPCKPKKVVLLVQKEVAEKICDSKNHSILSLQVHIYGTPSLEKIVEKNKFYPTPKVDSAILKIQIFSHCLIPKKYLKKFWQITHYAFKQKRKKIANTLGKQKINKELTFKDIFQKIGLDDNKRPQNLSITEWLNILKE